MPTFPSISFPNFSNTQPFLKDSPVKPTSSTIDSKEFVKKASILVLGTFVTAGTVYLGYKKLLQSNPIDSNRNYLTPIATTILLPAIALIANYFKGQNPKLPKEDPSNAISNTSAENKDKKELAKKKMVELGLAEEVSEKLVNSDYFSSFLDSFWEDNVNLDDLQGLVVSSENWELKKNFIAKLKNAGISENVATDALLILPREELISTLNNELTDDEIPYYLLYIERLKKNKALDLFTKNGVDAEKAEEVINLFSEDECFLFIANENVTEALENFEYKKIIITALENQLTSADLAEKISKNIPVSNLDFIVKNRDENAMVNRIFDLSSIIEFVQQEFVSRLVNSGISDKAAYEASQLYDIPSLCRNISNKLSDDYINGFEVELEKLKNQWAINIFTDHGFDGEKAKEAVNLLSGDELFDFLRFEQNLEDLSKIIDNLEIKQLDLSSDKQAQLIQY